MESYINDYKDLKKLIAENLELPLMFMASDDCGNPDWGWTIASARAKKGVVLDTKGPNEEKLYMSEDELMKDIDDKVTLEHGEWTDEEVLEAVVEELKKYEDKWIDVIYVYIEDY